MRKILLASATAMALVVGVGAASAADPGEYQYFHDTYGTSNPDAWTSNYGTFGDYRQRGPAYGPVYGYAPAPAPAYGHGSGFGIGIGGVGIGVGSYD